MSRIKAGEKQRVALELSSAMAARRLAIVRMCVDFAELAGGAEIDTMHGLFEMWRSGRTSSDSEGRVLNEALRRSVWIEPNA